MINEAIDSFLKADDASHYEEVIATAKQEEAYDALINYLRMARDKVREPLIDNELIIAFAKTDRLANLEEFISAPNVAKIEDVGDRCFEDRKFEAARILFEHSGNNAKLALCFVNLGKFAEAVEAARKANSIPTWKAVCYACVDAKEFRLAAMCGVNIIVYQDHLQELIRHYETYGYFDEVIALLEQGMNLERAHQGIYTALGILYAKYKEEKLMEHIKLFWSRLNIPTLLAVCKDNLHWSETVFLYTHYDQFDNAVEVMIQHSAECWNNDQFKDIITRVSNTEMYYKALRFYLSEHPLLTSELLIDLASKVDHVRVVTAIRKENHLPLSQKYLLFVQNNNIPAINEAVNELWVEEENHKGLRESIDLYDQFDQIALAKVCEKHELVDFRRIAALLYKMNKRWDQSISLSKKDRLYKDAMETAAESRNAELAESLLRFFVDTREHDCFSASLFTCYELIRPDVVLELAWRNGLNNFAMPYMIQTIRDLSSTVFVLKAKSDAAEKKEQEARDAAKKAADEASSTGPGLMSGFAPLLAIGPPPADYAAYPPNPYGVPPPPMGFGPPQYPPQYPPTLG